MKLLLFLFILCCYVSSNVLLYQEQPNVASWNENENTTLLPKYVLESVTPLGMHIFEYFDEAAMGRWFIISEKHGIYEMMYDDRVSRTLRVHFENDTVRMVWLAWRIGDDGRDYEVETDVNRSLHYEAYGTSRVVEIDAFERIMNLCNDLALDAFKTNNPALMRLFDDMHEFLR